MNRLNWLRNLEQHLRPTKMMSLIGLLLLLVLPRNSYAQIVIQPSSSGGGGGGSIVGGTCSNQAITAIDTSGNITCTTITSAYVSNSIALTGTDINTSNQVTATHLASALPFSQGGLGFTVAAVGDLIYASATNAINKLVDIATGNVLLSGGANTSPAYGKVTSGHVDSSVALTGSSLAQFASTTSAQLATLLSDETGSGLVVFGTSPTIVTPTIASFANATHNHTNTAGGGTLAETSLAFTDITTLNASSSAHGLQAKLSGNAYDFHLGDGTYGQTVAAGTITTSKPWAFTQTWNAGGVTFTGLQVSITRTAAASASKSFSVLEGGTCYLGVNSASTTGCTANISAGGLDTTGALSVHSAALTMDTTRHIQWSGSGALFNPNSMEIQIQGGTGNGLIVVGGAMTCSSGCGTSPTIDASGTLGRITLGTSPSATTVVLNFPETLPVAPSCYAVDETSGATALAIGTTTQLTLTGVFAVADKLSFHCFTWRANV